MSSLPLMSCDSVLVGANMTSHDTHALCRSPLILRRIFLRKKPFITFMWNFTQLWLLWYIPGWNPTLKSWVGGGWYCPSFQGFTFVVCHYLVCLNLKTPLFILI